MLHVLHEVHHGVPGLRLQLQNGIDDVLYGEIYGHAPAQGLGRTAVFRAPQQIVRSDIVEPQTILDSSMVEHSAVNRGVVGSSPTRGARPGAGPREDSGIPCAPADSP